MAEIVYGLLIGFAVIIIFLVLLLLVPSPMTELWYGLVPCLNCKGSGKKDDHPCKSCGGEGLVTVYLNRDGQSVKCPNKCPIAYYLCGLCGGTGWSGRIKKEERENLYKQERKFLIVCPICKGEGSYHTGEWEWGYGSNPKRIYERCDSCKGAGVIFGYFDGEGNIKYCDWCRKYRSQFEPSQKCLYCGSFT